MKYQIISERKEKYGIRVSYPSDLYPVLKRYSCLDKEHFIVCTLDGGHNVISVKIISIGILNRTLIHPREVFRVAIADNSASVILCHNHPSGSLEPSEQDREVTKRLVEAGELLGMKVLDHIIISKEGYRSFVETNERSLDGSTDKY